MTETIQVHASAYEVAAHKVGEIDHKKIGMAVTVIPAHPRWEERMKLLSNGSFAKMHELDKLIMDDTNMQSDDIVMASFYYKVQQKDLNGRCFEMDI